MSSNSIKQTISSEKNSDGREATRTILEDVCSDFETMNVVASKSNKVGVIRSTKTRNSTPQNFDHKNSGTNVQKDKSSSSNTSLAKRVLKGKTPLPIPTVSKDVTNKTSSSKDLSSNKCAVKENIKIEENDEKPSASITSAQEIIHQNRNDSDKNVEKSIASEIKHLEPPANSHVASEAAHLKLPITVLNAESNVAVNSELLPLNSCHEATNVAIVPKSFTMDKNLSSLAQLADAEIVQSGDNVSIVVSNPRFIEVLTNTSTPISTLETGTVIETPAAVIGSESQQIELVESSILTSSSLQDLTISEDLNMISEKGISSKNCVEIGDTKISPKTGKRRGRPPKSSVVSRKSASPPPSYIPSTHFTRGRRITTRMRAAWARLLEMKGRLVCQMPGCSQTFVTVANYQTHFKYCSGKKTLQKCDYCDSMIFSTHKAILQHMEVEHPEKSDEYRAAHQEEILEFEKNNAPDHLIISEDENVAMNIEEITQDTQGISRKRKLSERESTISNKKVILKHKLQSIQNSMAENAKEFKKCVRFDTITDSIKSVKISSLEEACKVETSAKKFDRRIKRVFTEKIVAADKYFEDDEEVDQPKTEEELEKEKLREKMHTKARLMLNLERYKRYQEYLTVTRDWSSERKTYSRSRGSDVSAENSFSSQMLNESFQDINLLNNVTESSSISLNNSEVEINSIQMAPVETYQVVETPHFVSAVALEPDAALANKPPNISTMSLNLSSNESNVTDPLTYTENRVRREKTACYNRVNFENPKPKPRLGGIITYGIKVPDENANKLTEPPVTFDSLVNFMKPKPGRRNSQAEDIENIPKEDNTKLSTDKDVIVPASKKRGRPPKLKGKGNKTGKIQKGHVKKYSAAMLKTAEINVKNKKIRFFGIKKKLKSKKYASLQARKVNLKNIKLKQLKNNLILEEIGTKKKKHNKKRSIDVSAIQCQENIDNHLPVGQGINISNITCLSSDHNYTNTLNQMIVDANIAGEIEIVSSFPEQVSDIVTEQVSDIVIKQCSNITERVSDVTEQVSNITEGVSDVIEQVSDVTKQVSNITEGVSDVTEQVSDVTEHVTGVVTEQVSDIVTEQVSDIVTEQVSDIVTKQDSDIVTEQVSNIVADQVSSITEQVSDVVPQTSNIVNEQVNAEIKSVDKLAENLSLNEVEKTEIIDKENLNEVNSVESVNDQTDEKFSKTVILVQESNDEPINILQKDIKHFDTCVKLVHKDIENIDKSLAVMSEDHKLERKLSDEQVVSNLENSVAKQVNIDSTTLNDAINDIQIQFGTKESQPVDNENNVNLVPEVPIKRGRGRPRKNSRKIAPKVSNVNSSQSDASKNHELQECSVTEIYSEVRDKSNISKVLDVDNLGSCNKKTILPVRKSERVRKRKLVNDELFQMSTIETKQNEELTPPIPVIKSGRRGRSRKSEIQESCLEIINNKAEESKEKASEIELDAIDENMRKFSRKGRPRKCVRYADLNSGLESSESMDGTHNANIGKNKSDSTNEKNAKVIKKLQNSIEVTFDSKSEEENIVLPLKKRKQRQTKKIDSESDKAKLSKIVDDEIFLSEDSQNKFEENEDSSEKRTLRGRKRGTKRKKYEEDTSDEEWNPEVHLKSIGKTSNRKSHLNILDLEETSDSSCSERRDASFTKREGDAIRKFASRPVKDQRLDVVAAKYSFKTSEQLFVEYKSQKRMWKILSEDDYILPPMKTSPYFQIRKSWDKSEAYWNSLDLFDSVPLDNDSCHNTFFTGGPVTCSAWCPTPVESNKVQYVFLSVSSLMNKLHTYVCDEPEKGFLQLWNMGDLNRKILQRKPFMEMSIFHKYGPINDMVWCPYGCWENPEIENSSEILPRLGLLAVACSDSNIRIYSIPHPHLLPKEGTNFPVYSACPSVILESLCSNICIATKKSVCVSLSWQKTDNCERIAAGYGNGMICVWHVNSSATVLSSKENNQIVIKPYLVFSSHGTPVLGLSFSPLPGGRFLVSASTDKTLKFWDLIDTSLPVYTVKKGAGKCAHWSSYYCGAFGSIQHGMNNFKGSTFFKECGTETISSRALSHPNCSIILSSLSDWLNALAIGDAAGNISVSFTHSLIHEHVKGPQYFQRYVYQSELKPVEGIVDKIIFSSYLKSASCIEKLEEMKEIAVLLDETISLICGLTDIVEISVEQKSEVNYTEENCQMILNEAKEVVSVVHHVIESSEFMTFTSKEDDVEDIQQDFIGTVTIFSERECNVNEEEKKELSEAVLSNLFVAKDIVSIMADVSNVMETVDNLICSEALLPSSSITNVISPKILMEDISISSEVSKTIQSSVEIVQLLDFLIISVDKDEESYYTKKLSSGSELDINENAIANICSEGIACISAVDEVSNLITVMDSITESCSKSDVLNISLQNENAMTLAQCEDGVCTSTIKEISNIIIAVENLADHCINSESTSFEKKRKDNRKHSCSRIGLTHNLSEMVEVISTVSDMQDAIDTINCMTDAVEVVLGMKEATEVVLGMKEATEVVLDIKDTTEVILDMKDTTEVVSELKTITKTVLGMDDIITCTEGLKSVISSTEDLNDFISSSEDIKEIISSTEDLRDIISSSENIKDIISSAEGLKDITVISEKLKNKVTVSNYGISSTIYEIVERISKDVDSECESSKVMKDLLCNTQILSKFENMLSSPVVSNGGFTASKNCVSISEIPSNLSTEMTGVRESVDKYDDNLCKNFDYSLHLPVEIDEQMLSADSESSNSDNDTDTEDEMEIDESYLFDQDSNLSDDSILSECSLDSAASLCSFSTESDMSVDSAASIQGEQEIDNLVSSHYSNIADTLPSASSPKLSDLTFEGKIIASSENLDIRSSTKDLTTNVLDNTESSKDFNEENAVQEMTFKVVSDTIVPDPHDIIFSEDKSVSEAIDGVVYSHTSKVEHMSPISEIPEQIESKTVVSQDIVSVNFLNNSDKTVHSNDSITEMPCDNSSTKVSIESSKEICTESTDKLVNCKYFGSVEETVNNTSNNCIPSETIESISKSSEISLKDIVNSEQNEIHENSMPLEVESCIINKETMPENFSCYEDVISQYGIVFKDMNTAKFDKIEYENFKELDEYSLNRYHLTSIKTVSWNPNYGSHHWLLSAGQSGIARLSYISDILQANSEKKTK